jgi:GntR family transcriptional regulator
MPESRGLFHYDRGGGIPAYLQLKEQVKIALALGKLRPGDMLPSIRRIEEELGIGRMLVRKAYCQLQEAGLVAIVHGRGAVVTGYGSPNGRTAAKVGALVARFVDALRREGIDALSFSRLFHQRLLAAHSNAPRILCVDSSEILARELGRQVQRLLGVPVLTTSVPGLRKLRRGLPPDVRLIVNYYYLEDARRILKGRRNALFPVSWDYAPVFLERLRSLPIGSRVLLLFFEASLKHEGPQLVIQELLQRVQDRAFDVTVKAVERAGRLERLARSSYRAVLVSNLVWDKHDAVLERHPDKFWRLATRLNHQSLETISEKLGIVV